MILFNNSIYRFVIRCNTIIIVIIIIIHHSSIILCKKLKEFELMLEHH